jgi:hypothetical protein
MISIYSFNPSNIAPPKARKVTECRGKEGKKGEEGYNLPGDIFL